MARVAIRRSCFTEDLLNTLFVIYFYDFITGIIQVSKEEDPYIYNILHFSTSRGSQEEWYSGSESEEEKSEFLRNFEDYYHRSKNNKSISGLTRFKYNN